jgi:hypothetical protein
MIKYFYNFVLIDIINNNNKKRSFVLNNYN